MGNDPSTHMRKLIAEANELKDRGLSLREIAKEMGGISPSTAWKYLNYERWREKQREKRQTETSVEVVEKVGLEMPEVDEDIESSPLFPLILSDWIRDCTTTVDCEMLEMKSSTPFCNFYGREINPFVDCHAHAERVIEHYVATHPETEQAEVPAEATGESLPPMPTIRIPIWFTMAHLLLAIGIWFGFIEVWTLLIMPFLNVTGAVFEGLYSIGWVISFILLGVTLALRKRIYEGVIKLRLKARGF